MPLIALCVALSLGAVLSPVTGMAEAPAPVGVWLTDDGDGTVEIRRCGKNLCGYVYSILHLPHPDRPAVDARNQNPELRNRPLCGLQVLGSLQPISAETWGDGWVYDPKVGKTYGVDITVKGQTLAVYGYLPGKLLGRTVTWTHIASPPARCTRR